MPNTPHMERWYIQYLLFLFTAGNHTNKYHLLHTASVRSTPMLYTTRKTLQELYMYMYLQCMGFIWIFHALWVKLWYSIIKWSTCKIKINYSNYYYSCKMAASLLIFAWWDRDIPYVLNPIHSDNDR